MGGYFVDVAGPVSGLSPTTPGAYTARSMHRVDATHALLVAQGGSARTAFILVDHSDPYNVVWGAAWTDVPSFGLSSITQVSGTRFVAAGQDVGTFASGLTALRVIDLDLGALTVTVGPENDFDPSSPMISEPWLSAGYIDDQREFQGALITLDTNTVGLLAQAQFNDYAGLTPSGPGILSYVAAVDIASMTVLDQQFVRGDVQPSGSGLPNHRDIVVSGARSRGGNTYLGVLEITESVTNIWSVTWTGAALSFGQMSGDSPNFNGFVEMFELLDGRWLLADGDTGGFFIATSDFSGWTGPHPDITSSGHDRSLEFGGGSYFDFAQAQSGLVYAEATQKSLRLDTWDHPRATGTPSGAGAPGGCAVPVESNGGDTAMDNRLWVPLGLTSFVLAQVEEGPVLGYVQGGYFGTDDTLILAENGRRGLLYHRGEAHLPTVDVGMFTPDKYWHPLARVDIDWDDGVIDSHVPDLTLRSNSGGLVDEPDISHTYTRPGVFRIALIGYDSAGYVVLDELTGVGDPSQAAGSTVVVPGPAFTPPLRQSQRSDGAAGGTPRATRGRSALTTNRSRAKSYL